VILLMGGTSESAMIAEALTGAGFRVLVSMATDVPLAIPSEGSIELRRGRLNLERLTALIRERSIVALVDATHPFAMEAHRTAERAAQNANVPYVHWLREESDFSSYPDLRMASGHEEAARMAAASGRPILLTIGSRNVLPYVRAARAEKLPIYARVLPCEESAEACRAAGLTESEVIEARGPFSVEDTLGLIRSLKIGTLVTKESGYAGGVPEKLEAAARAVCDVIVVKRAKFNEGSVCRTLDGLFSMLSSCLAGK
jgi:precorrin-6A/cobalt-precorrin-6A reductase